jgi:hypothetical protein|tara:strand:+ start:249 stop:479 length:231 start_codon:yes stop_codon:yes gene_type:complete
MLERLRNTGAWIRELTEVSLGLLALAVVLQVLFGATVPFFPIDVVGSVVEVTMQLGSEGLVGLVAVWALIALFNRN